jgi:cation diffusion facilitator family transporter
MKNTPDLRRYAWLSVAAAVATIALKSTAWGLTGSVGLLSDALESLVNLAGAVFALWMIAIAARPADDDHPYGHGKAEYFSAGAEGVLIAGAAAAILVAAVDRLLHPQLPEQLGWGLAFAGAATVINLTVGQVLLRVGRAHGAIALEADGRHLMTDVVTSVGVGVGLVLVWLTGFAWLDPVLAIAVALHIAWHGASLVRRAVDGLMDAALPSDEEEALRAALAPFAAHGVQVAALKSRRGGQRRFAALTVHVPGDWTVTAAHDEADRMEHALTAALPGIVVEIHVEPRAGANPDTASAPVTTAPATMASR